MQGWWTAAAAVTVIAIGTVASHRMLARYPLLIDETDKHLEQCQDENPDATCTIFVECAGKFPSKDECWRLGGLLEVPYCNYWSNTPFNVSVHGTLGCIRKYIMTDYKGLCDGDEEKKTCESFVSCCKHSAHGNCSRYDSAELEHPTCSMIPSGSFDYDEAICQCATDSPEIVLRTTLPDPGPDRSTGDVTKAIECIFDEGAALETDAAATTATSGGVSGARVVWFGFAAAALVVPFFI